MASKVHFDARPSANNAGVSGLGRPAGFKNCVADARKIQPHRGDEHRIAGRTRIRRGFYAVEAVFATRRFTGRSGFDAKIDEATRAY